MLDAKANDSVCPFARASGGSKSTLKLFKAHSASDDFLGPSHLVRSVI
jgi:hypothetical protein